MEPATGLPDLLRAVFVALVRQEGRQLSCRQLALLLVCHLEEGPHTLLGLAERLVTDKLTITQCIDRLVQLELVKRISNPEDRRGVLIDRTAAGHAFVAELQRIMATAAADLRHSLPHTR